VVNKIEYLLLCLVSTLCILVGGYRRFGGTACHRLKGRRYCTYQTTRYHSPEEQNMGARRGECLKSHTREAVYEWRSLKHCVCGKAV